MPLPGFPARAHRQIDHRHRFAQVVLKEPATLFETVGTVFGMATTDRYTQEDAAAVAEFDGSIENAVPALKKTYVAFIAMERQAIAAPRL